MSRTDLYLLVETPYMGRTDATWLEKVFIYGSSVKSISGKVPYIWVVSQVNFWKGSLYMEPQSVYFWWEVHIAVLWVSELILWVSELIPLYFGCLNLYFGCQRTKHCGMTCESGCTEGPSILV